MGRTIFLHVGYPKTATTTIQEGIFQKHSGLRDLSHVVEADGSINDYTLLSDLDASGKPVVISNERLLEPRADFMGNAIRLKESVSSICEEVEILFTLRNQLDLVKSSFTFWNGYFKKEGYDDINNMINNEIGKKNTSTNFRSWLSFYNVVSEYSKIFGKESINIIKYEDLSNNRDKFIGRISSLMEVDENEILNNLNSSRDRNVQSKNGTHTKPGWMYWKMSVIKSSFFPNSPPIESFPFGSAIKRLLAFGNREVEVSEESINILREEYAESNRKLFNEYCVERCNEYMF